MITYQNRKGWQRSWLVALAVGGALGVGGWWWYIHSSDSVASGVERIKSAAWPGITASGPKVEPALIAAPAILEDGRPADFTPEDWTALKAAMAKTPNPKAETERVVKYLRFQRGFEQWQGLKASPDVAQRQQLAKRLLEQVPDRLHQGEMTMGEALMLETALWTDLEPNEELRKQRVEEAKTVLANATPKIDPQEQAREASMLTEYKRREAAIVADWQAKPVAERNQAQLEEALEAARRAVYVSNKN